MATESMSSKSYMNRCFWEAEKPFGLQVIQDLFALRLGSVPFDELAQGHTVLKLDLVLGHRWRTASGLSDQCGLARLEARPVTTLCVEAQERSELRERQTGAGNVRSV